ARTSPFSGIEKRGSVMSMRNLPATAFKGSESLKIDVVPCRSPTSERVRRLGKRYLPPSVFKESDPLKPLEAFFKESDPLKPSCFFKESDPLKNAGSADGFASLGRHRSQMNVSKTRKDVSLPGFTSPRRRVWLGAADSFLRGRHSSRRIARLPTTTDDTMAPRVQSIPWKKGGKRAVLLVHGVGNAQVGDYADLVQQVATILGADAADTPIYMLYYDQVNDWFVA